MTHEQICPPLTPVQGSKFANQHIEKITEQVMTFFFEMTNIGTRTIKRKEINSKYAAVNISFTNMHVCTHNS